MNTMQISQSSRKQLEMLQPVRLNVKHHAYRSTWQTRRYFRE